MEKITFILKSTFINNVEINPLYNDISIIEELEPDQVFFRLKINGDIKCINSDYDLIMSQDFDTVFNLTIISRYGTYNGTFIIYDCENDADNKIIKIKLNLTDEYNKLMSLLDKEINIFKENTKKVPIRIAKRNILQVYMYGDDVCSNFLAGNYWESSVVNDLSESEIVSISKFTLCYNIYRIVLTGNNSSLDVSGLNSEYITDHQSDEYLNSLYLNSYTGNYSVSMNIFVGSVGDPNPSYSIYLIKDGEVQFSTEQNGNIYEATNIFLSPNPDTTNYGTINVIFDVKNIYSRLLTEQEYINSTLSTNMPENDIFYTQNYKKIHSYKTTGIIVTNRYSSVPTQYGLNGCYDYFETPDDNRTYYPISKSMWNLTSMWYYFTQDDLDITNVFHPIIKKDVYHLTDVISKILEKLNLNIIHEGLPEYSSILYSTDPITHRSSRLFISQKTNILSEYYDKPAQKEIISLRQIFDLLKNTKQIYPYIEGGKLKFEHISYFTKSENAIDIRNIINVRNNKKWTFDKNIFNYDTINESIIQFEYMDDVSYSFKGFDIEYKNHYAMDKGIKSITINNFTPDIDLMFASPDDFSKDGFALFDCVYTDMYSTEILNIIYDDESHYLQNGTLSFPYLHLYYWKYDSNCDLIMINGNITHAVSIKKNKISTFKIPFIDLNGKYSIITDMGVSKFFKKELNLLTGFIDLKIGNDPQ